MTNFTKNAIKSAFVDLLDEFPLGQITIKMIVNKCGINRNSFYYHYRDMPSLIEEIVKEEADRIIKEYPTIHTVEMALKVAVDFASKHRRPILHIYNSVNRDIFEQYLWNVCDYVVEEYGKSVLKDKNISDSDYDLIAQFFKCECFGVVIAWLNERMDSDIFSQISRFCKLHRGMIEEMILRSNHIQANRL